MLVVPSSPKQPHKHSLILFIGLTFLASSSILKAQEPTVETPWMFATGDKIPKQGIMLAYQAMVNSPRMKSNLEYIRENQHLCNYPFNYYAVNYSTVNSTHIVAPDIFYREAKTKVRPADPKFRGSVDLWAKLWSSMRFFLENTNYTWLWRGTDDVLVIFERLGPFMEEMDRNYDPLTERVVMGHCIYNRPTGYSWLQGGSGMLFSRRAVEIMEPKMGELMEDMVPDDIRFSQLMELSNISWKSATCERFMGHYPGKRYQRLLRHAAFNKMRKCPNSAEEVPATKCRKFVSPISDIVFYHAQVRGSLNVFKWTLRTYNKYLKNLPRSVKWWMDARDPVVCYDGNEL